MIFQKTQTSVQQQILEPALEAMKYSVRFDIILYAFNLFFLSSCDRIMRTLIQL